MRVDIITLFPDMVDAVANMSIIGRARKNGVVEINAVNLRDFARDKYGTVDDTPFGGGAGMLLKPDVIFDALESLRSSETFVILLTPQGEPFRQTMAREFAQKEHIILLCGHYEGVDERVRQTMIDMELSVGDYVVTNGTLPAMIVADAVIRLLPGVLGSDESAADDSFGDEGLLEYPQYTRPAEFNGMRVPDILLSGNHEAIRKWRHEQAEARTRQRRPDLIKRELEKDQ
jgi:tRNA (guanine37-N1)-methyltransferase